ncbi:HNH endonuclease [Pyxidicoccus parkwayensis]|jgi:5-methylcytosine-specific restriction endonuclease McrA|uniref:HNH endonuclease n=1 Tax=Pyxidicoccus parkwayensis TaxID=2813578 RepID=A0ABX7P8Z3_9BACT|nr:HNH endonuclease [Pyxidicoccus parkwaysis]QSQ26892.1 HNH endonuclease [Pyxidicoccus parkwaysis]
MINSAVLVLNRYYQPVHVTSVKRAFSLLYQGVAKAIDAQYRLYEFDDWAALSATQDCITTINRTIRVPRVLVLSAYDHLPRGRVRFSRLNIYARDNDTCQYCGKNLPRSDLNLDHVLPRSQGGKTTWENVVCSCVPCNLKKGGRTPEQAEMRLLKKPVRPRWTPLFRGATRKVTYREWLPFLHLADASYWNVELLDE